MARFWTEHLAQRRGSPRNGEYARAGAGPWALAAGVRVRRMLSGRSASAGGADRPETDRTSVRDAEFCAERVAQSVLYGGAMIDPDSDVDHLGERRLQGREMWFWYLFAGISYSVLSLWHKFLLNWLIGPLWLAAVVWIGPALFDRLRGHGE